MTSAMRNALLATLLLSFTACGNASAKSPRDCGQWLPGAHPARVRAATKTPCTLALSAARRITNLSVAAGAPFQGRLVIGQTALRCAYHRRGHVVYTCTAPGTLVQLWAAKRT